MRWAVLDSSRVRWSVLFGSHKKFSVEHALLLIAEDFVRFPAWAIYDNKILQPFADRICDCHVYLIGFTPQIDFEGAEKYDQILRCHLKILGQNHMIDYPLPEGLDLHYNDEFFFLADNEGKRFFPSPADMQRKLHLEVRPINFDVQYIGQAFGKDGSRSALDRLKKHETLQKISLRGVPDGHIIELILVKVNDASSVITSFNPFAKDDTTSKQRISYGINKLYEPNEAEAVTLFEASLIRYFEPTFNIEFKNNFPSTNMKILSDCYEKDFSSIVAEMNFDEMGFNFKSDRQKPSEIIAAKYNLHNAEDRDFFFGLKD